MSDKKKISVEMQRRTETYWATEDRKHVIMKEII